MNRMGKDYQRFTDQQGNILSVVDENGGRVFDATYDAWGRQTVTLNTICLHRGYTGHEMMGEFGLINMNRRSLARSGESNGRVYDPTLGRFLSPDNYVQARQQPELQPLQLLPEQSAEVYRSERGIGMVRSCYSRCHYRSLCWGFHTIRNCCILELELQCLERCHCRWNYWRNNWLWCFFSIGIFWWNNRPYYYSKWH